MLQLRVLLQSWRPLSDSLWMLWTRLGKWMQRSQCSVSNLVLVGSSCHSLQRRSPAGDFHPWMYHVSQVWILHAH
jgi:hypothetical protein